MRNRTETAITGDTTITRPTYYLDHAATAPVSAAARAAMVDGLSRWANPSSPHAAGRAARAALEDARARIATALDWPHTVILTSGASEALAIALTRAKVLRHAVSAVEHDAVLRVLPDAMRLPVNGNGTVQLDEPWLDGPPALIAIQSANNETGVLQPLAEIAAKLRAVGHLLVADCAQTAGKLPLPDADFIAVSAHKLGGPPGIGALLIRDLATLAPSGGQEQGYRGGTENMPATLGFAAALEDGSAWLTEAARLRDKLETGILASGGEVIACDTPRLATIGAYRLPGVAATTQLIRMDMVGIAISAGSACSSGSLKPGHVLAAMGLAPTAATETIRVSIGRDTGDAAIDAFLASYAAMAARRAAA
ncbi:cysteine desulfurase family protein [Sphingomonas prati]|uniref:Cysteine desulfurase n=1 Tax=Sphingomonas prati TaxID=1843237 RepID=A0A7W9BQN0_9SPHN|nr:aminotransferase class V-fold PLP-dependent enzyme [Sphingomonas prati]MBB5728186.1 cysteine desulfurase [Sphingomonas prati]